MGAGGSLPRAWVSDEVNETAVTLQAGGAAQLGAACAPPAKARTNAPAATNAAPLDTASSFRISPSYFDEQVTVRGGTGNAPGALSHLRTPTISLPPP